MEKMEVQVTTNDDLISTMRYSTSQGWNRDDVHVIGESTLTLSVNGIEWISFQCTPLEQTELACGFLYNEGIIETQAEIADAQLCPDGSHIDLWLSHAAPRPETWKRTSGCGGGATHREAPFATLPSQAGPALDPMKILALLDQFGENQVLYRETGGIHSSGLSDGNEIVHLCEDIGRHNTLDKLAGYLLLNPQDLERRILMTTGRISSEMLQKAARLRAEVIVSRTSPTIASIRLADQAGITLAGYARHSQMLVYTHSERLGMG
jgi:FdhD protein